MKFDLKQFNIKTFLAANQGNFKKIPWVLGRHAFLVMMSLIFLGFLLGAGLFYANVMAIEATDQQISAGTTKFEEHVYQQILKEWEAKIRKFQSFDSQLYTNPFKNVP